MRVTLRSRNLDRILGRRNWSRRRFAQLVGISPAFASQLLNGDRCPSPVVRTRILNVLPECRFEDVFAFTNGSRRRRKTALSA
jgi:transcriptional regulator with XRE-family HTH domain